MIGSRTGGVLGWRLVYKFRLWKHFQGSLGESEQVKSKFTRHQESLKYRPQWHVKSCLYVLKQVFLWRGPLVFIRPQRSVIQNRAITQSLIKELDLAIVKDFLMVNLNPHEGFLVEKPRDSETDVQSTASNVYYCKQIGK